MANRITVVRLPPRAPAAPRRTIWAQGQVHTPVIDTEVVPTYPGTFYPGTAYPSGTSVTTSDGTVIPPTPGASGGSSAPTAAMHGGWGGAQYGRQAWGGNARRKVMPSGGVQPDDSTVQYFWNSRIKFSSWTRGSWAGKQTQLPIAGGITINPDKRSGTVAIQAWWLGAKYLRLVRVTKDGTQTPVRGYSPFPVSGDTRHNMSVNPSCAVSTSGYTALIGSPSRLTGLSTPFPTVKTGLRVQQTATASGDMAIALPERLLGQMTTRGFLLRCSTMPTSVKVVTQWVDSDGNDLETTVDPINDAARTQSERNWSWCVASTFTPQAASYGTPVLVLTGIGFGETVDITANLVQVGTTLDGQFFDGDSAHGAWTGKPGLSQSGLAPVQYITDGEAPLDDSVTYLLVNPNAPGYSITSQDVSLPAVTFDTTWVTHPGAPNYPVKLWVQALPTRTRPIDQGVFPVIGRQNPIVKSSNVRRGANGSITMIADGESEAERLRLLMSDGQPLLVRAPKTHRMPGNWWISLGDMDEGATSHFAGAPLRSFAGKFNEVDAPVDYLSATSYGQQLTLAALGRLSTPVILGGTRGTVVPNPAYGVRFNSGLTSEGMTPVPADFESAVPTVVHGISGISGNALQIALASGGVSNPGPGASAVAGRQRVELRPNLVGIAGNADGLFGPGETGYFGLAVMLPSDFPVNSSAPQVITRFTATTGATEAFEVQIENGQMIIVNASGWVLPVCTIDAGHRYNIVLGVTFTESTSTSVIDVWVNGVHLIIAQHPTGAGFLSSGVIGAWRFGIFRSSTTTTATTIQFGAVAYDTSLDTVQTYIQTG